jgi:hypothetical protein
MHINRITVHLSLAARFVTTAAIFLSSVLVSRSFGPIGLLDFIYYSTMLNLISSISLRDWEYKVFSKPTTTDLLRHLVISPVIGALIFLMFNYFFAPKNSSIGFLIVVIIYCFTSVLISIFKIKALTQPIYEFVKSGSFGIVGLTVTLFFVFLAPNGNVLEIFQASSLITLCLSFSSILILKRLDLKDQFHYFNETSGWSNWMVSISGILLLTLESILSRSFVGAEYASYYGVYNRVVFLCYAGFSIFNNHVIRLLANGDDSYLYGKTKRISFIACLIVFITYPMLFVVYIGYVDINFRLAFFMLACAIIQVGATYCSAGDFYRLMQAKRQIHFLWGFGSLLFIYLTLLYFLNEGVDAHRLEILFFGFVFISVLFNLLVRLWLNKIVTSP